MMCVKEFKNAPQGYKKDMKRPVVFLDIKMPVLLKLMCMFNVIPIKITTGLWGS